MSSFILIVLARQAPWVVSFPNCRNFCAYRLLTLTSPFPSSSTSTTYISEVLGARDKPVAPLSSVNALNSTQSRQLNSRTPTHKHKTKGFSLEPILVHGTSCPTLSLPKSYRQVLFPIVHHALPRHALSWHLIRAAFSSGPMKASVNRPVPRNYVVARPYE
ncbi:hypothetical protein EDB80DRAFT_153046 [Ilyonectria destructans]|nr:hypothetical protein EDB80DRAFT_153046 [Ilyonectria destructans]